MEGANVVDTASQLEALMDDNGDFVETEEVQDEGHQGVTEGHVEDFEEEEESEETTEEETEEEESEEESEEEETEGELFEVTIGEDVYEVNLEELTAGYLRNEDLLKRHQDLEAEYQEKLDAAEQERSQLIGTLQQLTLANDVGLQKFQNVNWDQLKAKDPEAYKDALVEFTEAQRQAQLVKGRQSELQKIHQKAQEIKHAAYLKQQQEVAQRLIPELANEETRQGFTDAIVKYGKSIGYTEDDLLSIADAKALFVLDQARKYSEMKTKHQTAKEKVSKDLPQAIKPGTPKTKGQEQTRRTKELQARFKSSHDIRDAAALLEAHV